MVLRKRKTFKVYMLRGIWGESALHIKTVTMLPYTLILQMQVCSSLMTVANAVYSLHSCLSCLQNILKLKSEKAGEKGSMSVCL